MYRWATALDCNNFPEFYKNRSKKTDYFYSSMKKLLILILAFLYLGTSIGATVNLHYCMGRLVKWDFAHKQQQRNCEKCGMEKVRDKKTGCCEDKYKLLQVEKDQKAENAYHAVAPLAVAAITTYPLITIPIGNSFCHTYPVCNAPPNNQVPLRIRYSIFRI